jgi:hypothetical protein
MRVPSAPGLALPWGGVGVLAHVHAVAGRLPSAWPDECRLAAGGSPHPSASGPPA